MYIQPNVEAAAMQPQSIICASVGENEGGTQSVAPTVPGQFVGD